MLYICPTPLQVSSRPQNKRQHPNQQQNRNNANSNTNASPNSNRANNFRARGGAFNARGGNFRGNFRGVCFSLIILVVVLSSRSYTQLGHLYENIENDFVNFKDV